MRVLVAGDRDRADAVARALEDAGLDAQRAFEVQGEAAGEGELSSLAARLLEYETQLEASPADALLVTDASDEALAAVLVATKVPIPVGFMAEEGAGGGVNGRLISRLADGTVNNDAEAVAWLQDLLPT